MVSLLNFVIALLAINKARYRPISNPWYSRVSYGLCGAVFGLLN